MVKGFILEYDKREGLICKKVKEWEGSLRNNEKGRGFWAKSPFFSLLPSRRTGEARLGAGGGPRRRPRARQWPGPWGKERGRLVGSTPPLDFREEGPQGGEPWWRAAVGGGGRGGATAGLDGGQGEKGD